METMYYTDLRKTLTKLMGVLCLCLIVVFSSCEKENGRGTPFALKDNPTDMTVSAQRESQTFTVQTTGSWKVRPLQKQRWVKIEPTEGNGEGTFTVTVDRNTTLEARESVLTFVVDGDIKNNILRIEQEAGGQEGGTD